MHTALDLISMIGAIGGLWAGYQLVKPWERNTPQQWWHMPAAGVLILGGGTVGYMLVRWILLMLG